MDHVNKFSEESAILCNFSEISKIFKTFAILRKLHILISRLFMLLKLEIFLTGSSDNFEDQNYMFNFE